MQPEATPPLPGTAEFELGRLRQRLLDLTTANRLLNFRSSDKSPRVIQIVDELPNNVYELLTQKGTELVLAPLPESDEDSEDDPDESPEDSNVDDVTVQQVLPFDSHSATPDPTAADAPAEPIEARPQIDLNPDLPLPPAPYEEPQERHTDAFLQTRLKLEPLEARLRKIASDAGSAVEETGVNMLHLSFGFLEWYESADSTVARKAPLILVPVRLQKDRVVDGTECYRYKVIYEGEDIQQNISLREKLKQDFGLVLPELDPEVLPEEYFKRVQEAVAAKSPWIVRRQIVLGFFHFSKLRMYLDLDPKNWPTGDGINSHSIVKDLLEGRDSDDALPVGESQTYDPNTSLADIPLVVDADGSQHRALAAALAGQNLVIEGPPGTGKSQTITNLIAAALARRKTVLFVAEKLAALEVVRKNLDSAGLGDFCLELHSRKAKKRTILDEIARRLYTDFERPDDWDHHLVEHESVTNELSLLSKALSEPAGSIGEPIWKVLWNANHFREICGHIQPQALPKADTWTKSDVGQRSDRIDDLAEHFKQLNPAAVEAWKWLHVPRLYPSGIPSFTSCLKQIETELTALQGLTDGLPEPSKAGLELTVPGLLQLCEAIESCPTPDFAKDHAALTMRLRGADADDVVASLDLSLQQHQKLQSTLNNLLGENPPILQPAALEALRQVLEVVDGSITWQAIQSLRQDVQLATADHRWAADIHARVASLFSKQATSWAEVLGQLQVALLAKAAPIDVLERPWPWHLSDGIEGVLTDAFLATKKHEEQRIELESEVNLESVPPLEEVRKLLATLRKNEGRLFRFLSGEYRSAKREVRVFIRNVDNSQSTCNLLDRLTLWIQSEKDLAEHADWTEYLGPLYRGVKTNWPRLKASVAWVWKLKNACGGYADAKWALEHLKPIAEAPFTSATDIARLSNLETVLKERLQLWVPSLRALPQIPWSEALPRLEDLNKRLDTLVKYLLDVAIPPSLSLSDLRDGLDAKGTLLKIEANLETSKFRDALGSSFCGLKTNLAQIQKVLQWSKHLDECTISHQVREWLRSTDVHERCSLLKSTAANLSQRITSLGEVFSRLEEWSDLEPESLLDTSRIASLSAKVRNSLAAEDALPKWAEYCRLIPIVNQAGLSFFAPALEEGRIPPDTLASFFSHCLYTTLASRILNENLVVRNISRATLENAIDRFRSRDRELQKLARKQLAFQIAAQRIPTGNGRGPVGSWTDRRLLEREISKQRRHVPIRQLMQRAADALLALKPCFLMSPLSVAQYLAPGGYKFDLVVMDEASQLRPEESLGAIARAKQVVVVGDPKQLPPTSFFDHVVAVNDDVDEEGVTDDTESILDVCLRSYGKAHRLKWHYRSRHESLIAFSNENFYDRDLLLFPSPTLDPGELGIRHRFIPNATFEGRKNLAEAQEVVRHIIEHAHREPNNTLGVVAFNGPQRDLIEELLESESKRNPRAARALELFAKMGQPLFIKNLENVQGDERDVIFVSYTYGPDPRDNKVYQRFGPINAENGWRRLNVLVTRARKRVELFTSMRAEDIHPRPDQRGVLAMKAYLEYAETGRWKDPGQITGRTPDSPFEVMVSTVLQQHGYTCVPQVGVAGFFIDIGVLNPDVPTDFILGVECDGATYHSSISIRDRDRLRQEILEARGWRIHRVWSTDWWINPKAETQRLVNALGLLRRSTIRRPAQPS